MRFALHINPYRPGAAGNPFDTLAQIARAAEETGYEALYLYDHLMWEGRPEQWDPPFVLEAFTTLGGLAAVTSKIRLGQMVLGNPYRNPALVAKMATTLDVISHGRSILGIGSGWYQREHDGYGYHYDDVPTRVKRLEEAVQVIIKLWTERPASFQGKYYRLDRALNDPPPVQKPHPPLCIGGGGEKVTLRLVAQYAQQCNLGGNPAQLRHKWDVLRQHCRNHRRDFDEIYRTMMCWAIIGRDHAEVEGRVARYVRPGWTGLAGTPDELIAFFRPYAEAGIQQMLVQFPDATDVEPVRQFGALVIPAFM